MRLFIPLMVFLTVGRIAVAQNGCGTELSGTDTLWFKSLPWVGNNDFLLDWMNSGEVAQPNDLPYKTSSSYLSQAKYRIPVQCYIVEDDNGQDGTQPAIVEFILRNVNDLFAQAGTEIQFYPLCAPVLIQDSYFLDSLGYSGVDTLFSMFTTDNAIDLFFVRSIQTPIGPGYDGVARFPFETHAFHSVVSMERMDIGIISGTTAHEMGHNLGLVHTHQCNRCGNNKSNHRLRPCKQESVSRTRGQGLLCSSTGTLKCEYNGDGLCDTPADPELKMNDNVVINGAGVCQFQGSISGEIENRDNWGDNWTPDVANIMSWADPCRATFSPMQSAAMQWTIEQSLDNYAPSDKNAFDLFEPDNTLSAARPLLSGVPQNHTFHWVPNAQGEFLSCDEDWVRVDLATPGTVSITTSAINGQPQPDTYLELYDSPTNTIASNDNSNGNWAAINNMLLPAGSYRLRITCMSPFPTPESRGAYQLSYNFTPMVATRPSRSEQPGIAIYPNPTASVLHLKGSSGSQGVFQLKLYDLTGRVVYSAQHNLDGNRIDTLELEHLESGPYFLTVKHKGESHSRIISIVK